MLQPKFGMLLHESRNYFPLIDTITVLQILPLSIKPRCHAFEVEWPLQQSCTWATELTLRYHPRGAKRRNMLNPIPSCDRKNHLHSAFASRRKLSLKVSTSILSASDQI